jgi:hypothetical protein
MVMAEMLEAGNASAAAWVEAVTCMRYVAKTKPLSPAPQYPHAGSLKSIEMSC